VAGLFAAVVLALSERYSIAAPLIATKAQVALGSRRLGRSGVDLKDTSRADELAASAALTLE
jgi:hypothetical protein